MRIDISSPVGVKTGEGGRGRKKGGERREIGFTAFPKLRELRNVFVTPSSLLFPELTVLSATELTLVIGHHLATNRDAFLSSP
jgi:hypothetical protein